MNFRKTAILAAATSVIAIGAASADTIKMAFIDPLSGPFGPSGEAAYTSFQLAAEHINANGGVMGKEIVPIIEDGASDAKTPGTGS